MFFFFFLPVKLTTLFGAAQTNKVEKKKSSDSFPKSEDLPEQRECETQRARSVKRTQWGGNMLRVKRARADTTTQHNTREENITKPMDSHVNNKFPTGLYVGLLVLIV